MQIKAADFQYTDEITAVSKKQYDTHVGLYNGYVNKANEIEGIFEAKKPKTGNTTYSEYRSLKKGQNYALDGIILHELYFKNMAESAEAPSIELKKAMEKFFGGYENWVEDFRSCALSARGWAVLVYEQRSNQLLNMLLDTHDNGIIMGSFPIIVLDTYEHAYFIDYADDRKKYFQKFIDNINWKTVNARFNQLEC